MSGHQLDHAYRCTNGNHVARCVCGESWERQRLADAAVALERHQHDVEVRDRRPRSAP